MTCGVYSISSPNGDEYIGASSHIKERWAAHRCLLRSGTHHSAMLQKAHDRDGMTFLAFCILEQCDKERLIEREQAQMDIRHPRYNRGKIARHGFQGCHHTPEANQRNSAAHIGRPLTAEHRSKIRAALTGNPKLIASLTGKRQTRETVEKRMAKVRGKRHRDGLEGRLGAEGIAKLLAEYQSGAGLVPLESKYHTTHKSIRRLLKEAGIPIRPRGLSAAAYMRRQQYLQMQPETLQ